MTLEDEILEATAGLPDKERAAALAHCVYVQTTRAKSSDWSMRVPDAWGELDEAARDFNLASIETWAAMPEVFDAWVAAVRSCRDSS